MHMCVCMLSHFRCVRCFVILWTLTHQAPLSMGFSRQEYWTGFPYPPLGDLPNPGIKPKSPVSPALQADSLPLSLLGSPIKAYPQDKNHIPELFSRYSCRAKVWSI